MLEEKALRDVLEIYDSGVTWADRMREKALTEAREQGLSEGRVKGLAEGRVEGRAEGVPAGERRLLLRQLELRFGPLPETARKRVGECQSQKVGRPPGRPCLTAHCDVNRDPRAHGIAPDEDCSLVSSSRTSRRMTRSNTALDLSSFRGCRESSSNGSCCCRSI